MLERLRVQVPDGAFLAVLAAGVVIERWVNYLWFEQAVVWGQPGNVVTMFVVSAFAFVMWLPANPRGIASGWLLVFLTAMAGAWLVHWLLYRYHSDAMNYTAMLYVPILVLTALKPPGVSGARLAVLTFAWTTAVVLVATRVLEMLDLVAIKSQSSGVITFDEERYFLPLNDLLGIDGRWPGPFGHNGDTAMMAALLVVIAIAFWSRSSWVFLVTGGLTLLLTNGRASIGAAAAGVVLLLMFSRSPRLQRFPRSLRIGAGMILLVAGALVMFARPAGLTGREKIWPAFLELWSQSPLLGVGGSGIANGNEVAQFYGHAHSLYIDELARWGLLGFVTQFAAVGIGVFIAARAARFGYPGPLAVIVTYLITGVTEPRNNWIVPSATGFLLILMVLAATAYLHGQGSDESRFHDPHADQDSYLTTTTGNHSRRGREIPGSGS